MARDNYITPSKIIDLDRVRELASLGLDYTEMAGFLGISAKTFSRRREDTPEIEQAIVEGRGQGIADVATALKSRAVSGDPAACKTFLNALGANFGKKSTVAVEAMPSISITLQGPNGTEYTTAS